MAAQENAKMNKSRFFRKSAGPLLKICEYEIDHLIFQKSDIDLLKSMFDLPIYLFDI
jgi:hypothetical protein